MTTYVSEKKELEHIKYVRLHDRFVYGLKEAGYIEEDIIHIQNDWWFCGGKDGLPSEKEGTIKNKTLREWELRWNTQFPTIEMPIYEPKCICHQHGLRYNCYITDGVRYLMLGRCCKDMFIRKRSKVCSRCNEPHRNKKDDYCNECRELNIEDEKALQLKKELDLQQEHKRIHLERMELQIKEAKQRKDEAERAKELEVKKCSRTMSDYMNDAQRNIPKSNKSIQQIEQCLIQIKDIREVNKKIINNNCIDCNKVINSKGTSYKRCYDCNKKVYK